MATKTIAIIGGPHPRDLWNSLKGDLEDGYEVKFEPNEGYLNPRDEHCLICVVTGLDRNGKWKGSWNIRAELVRDPFKGRSISVSYNSRSRTGVLVIEE